MTSLLGCEFICTMGTLARRGAIGRPRVDGKAEEEFDFDRSIPHPDQWQTPALWGVADSAPYFHDGGSPTLRSAIERHKGQANSSLQRFESLSTYDQKCLIQFLKTLKAPAAKPLVDETE